MKLPKHSSCRSDPQTSQGEDGYPSSLRAALRWAFPTATPTARINTGHSHTDARRSGLKLNRGSFIQCWFTSESLAGATLEDAIIEEQHHGFSVALQVIKTSQSRSNMLRRNLLFPAWIKAILTSKVQY
ncbi:hypothetical protein EYF80_053279 [Liparis tanakae]|uniref:Uncharacterized protein n=1 Tax=Liparis tanakae TaxID=230148 RepID=A0A4Z2F8B7_9TELE|nr:hypothetical protein EYF80_053279 [Liparis tanakae]